MRCKPLWMKVSAKCNKPESINEAPTYGHTNDNQQVVK